MAKFEIKSLFDMDDNIIHRPRVSYKIREYVWEYIYKEILEPKKIMADSKYIYRLTLDLNKFNPEKHKFFTDSEYNTESNKFRPENKFNTMKEVIKYASIRVVSNYINEDITPHDYSDLVYDMFGSFLILQYKKLSKLDFDTAKEKLDYTYINSFKFPASFEEQKYIGDDSVVDGVIIKEKYKELMN